MKRSLTHWAGGAVALAAVFVLTAVSACRADRGETPEGDPPAGAASLEASHLTHLARTGRFGAVLTRLKSDYPGLGDPSVGSLADAIQRYDQNRRQRLDKRREAYGKALKKVGSELEAGHVQDALIASINARSLAEHPAAVLHHDTVQRAVQRGAAEAKKAERSHDWVQALALYRALDLLYDDYATYHGDVKRVAQHVQVLQVFAPNRLEKLYKAQAKRRRARQTHAEKSGEKDDAGQNQSDAAQQLEKDEPAALEREPWQVRLRDIDPSMLRQTLREAARKHVDSHGYKPLLDSALGAMQVMLNTSGLSGTFPAFKNQRKVVQFEHRIQALRRRVNKGGSKLDGLDASSVIDQVLKANRQTLGLPPRVVVYELAEGVTDQLDPFSAVIWPEELSQFSRSTQGKFTGVGIKIMRKNGRLTVESPLAGTPAYRAGIQAGDVIAEVEGKKTDNWSMQKAVDQITGPEGTTVTLGIKRKGREKLVQNKIKRSSIDIESISGWQHTSGGKWDYFIDPRDRIGYVRLSQFLPQSVDDLDAAVEKMQKTGPIHGLILDLRFNPGGLLSSAVDVVDRFVRKGPIVYTVDADRKRTNELRAHPRATYKHFPVVVLVNQGSASASEITSGALQDYGRALIVGTRSFGKGSVQDLFPLDHGKAFFKLTTQYYMLPMGRIIHRKPGSKTWGIQPDLKVKMTNKQIADAMEYRQKVDVLRPNAHGANAKGAPTADKILQKGLDPQLAAALLVLRTHVVAQDLAIAQARAQAP